jgi:hypothetical protein
MWKAARGLLLRRVADAAVLHRYQQAGGSPNKQPGSEGEPRWPDMMTRVRQHPAPHDPARSAARAECGTAQPAQPAADAGSASSVACSSSTDW